jgi:hypothetical protein
VVTVCRLSRWIPSQWEHPVCGTIGCSTPSFLSRPAPCIGPLSLQKWAVLPRGRSVYCSMNPYLKKSQIVDVLREKLYASPSCDGGGCECRTTKVMAPSCCLKVLTCVVPANSAQHFPPPAPFWSFPSCSESDPQPVFRKSDGSPLASFLGFFFPCIIWRQTYCHANGRVFRAACLSTKGFLHHATVTTDLPLVTNCPVGSHAATWSSSTSYPVQLVSPTLTHIS